LNAGSDLSNNSTFQSFFKGVYVKVDGAASINQGAILYFDLLSSQSKLTLYYNDSLNFDFIIGSGALRVNHFVHDYTGTPVNAQLTGTAIDTDFVYVQAMAGVKTKILLPEIKHLTDSGMIVIN